MLKAKLIVVSGDLEDHEFLLSLPSTIGRSRSADIRLDDPLVSRRHCTLQAVNDELVVLDHESLNGTYVDQQRVNRQVLRDGDLVTVGNLTFRTCIGNDAPATADETSRSVEETVNMSDDSSIRAGDDSPAAESAAGDSLTTQRIDTADDKLNAFLEGLD